MPRLTAQTWQNRRRHVLISAFRCFARTGFHATTMDEIVGETQWSSSVVYRHVRGKEELVTAAIAETQSQLHSLLDELIGNEPVPSPSEALERLVAHLDDEAAGRSYHLAGLVIQAWAEALRTPELRESGHSAWMRARGGLAVLVRRWQEAGHLSEEVLPEDAAALIQLITSGIVVDTTHLGSAATDRALARLARLR